MQALVTWRQQVLFNFSNDVVVTYSFNASVKQSLWFTVGVFNLTPLSGICWIYSVQRGIGTGSCLYYIGSPLTLSFHQCALHIFHSPTIYVIQSLQLAASLNITLPFLMNDVQGLCHLPPPSPPPANLFTITGAACLWLEKVFKSLTLLRSDWMKRVKFSHNFCTHFFWWRWGFKGRALKYCRS
jgi:hypothetical protein